MQPMEVQMTTAAKQPSWGQFNQTCLFFIYLAQKRIGGEKSITWCFEQFHSTEHYFFNKTRIKHLALSTKESESHKENMSKCCSQLFAVTKQRLARTVCFVNVRNLWTMQTYILTVKAGTSFDPADLILLTTYIDWFVPDSSGFLWIISFEQSTSLRLG